MHIPTLNLPPFSYKTKLEGDKKLIFDDFRRKYVVINPEEWVRQHLLHYLKQELGYPQQSFSVEKSLAVDGLLKRYDAVVYDLAYKPLLLIEVKAPHVPINQSVFDQIARYNRSLNVPFLLVSNGLVHIMAKVDHLQGKYVFAPQIVPFLDLIADV